MTYEKTPSYAISRTAPLSVIAVLPPRIARFIYTLREIGDTVWSMYVHSGARHIENYGAHSKQPGARASMLGGW